MENNTASVDDIVDVWETRLTNKLYLHMSTLFDKAVTLSKM